jgi:hemerythrin-like domain-containing protein
MIEHRLIERMIALIGQEADRIEATGKVDPLCIDTVVDFISMYADRTHHGKEEDILFRELARKAMTAQDRQIMDELVSEHIYGRKITRELMEANTRFRNGDPAALAVVKDKLRVLTGFYPKHIEKEDKVFFPAARAYFSEAEDQAMLAAFREFDREMIHTKYRAVVQAMEG